jgi:hypothetical protein
VLFTSKDFSRRIKKKKKSPLIEVRESSSDDSESTTLDESDSEDSGEEQVPTQSKEQKKKDKEAAARRHARRVNSKVSLKYDASAASELAHEKNYQEQLKDKNCKDIRKALEERSAKEQAKGPLSITAEI